MPLIVEPGARVPALCSGLLTLGIVFQLCLPTEPELNAGAPPSAHMPAASPPAFGMVAPPSFILDRPIFAPRAAMTTEGKRDAAQSPLAGAVITGAIRIRALQYAVVRDASGRISRVSAGGRINGWRLAHIDGSGATLRKGGQSLHMPFGVTSAPVAQNNSEEEEE